MGNRQGEIKVIIPSKKAITYGTTIIPSGLHFFGKGVYFCKVYAFIGFRIKQILTKHFTVKFRHKFRHNILVFEVGAHEEEIFLSNEPLNTEPNAESADKVQIARNKYAAYEKQRKKGLSTKFKWGIAITILAILTAGGWYLVQHLLKSNSPESQIMTGYSMRGTIGANITGWGTAAAKEKAELGGKMIGKVEEVYVRAGDSVTIGTPLFRVDAEEAREKLSAAMKEQTQLLERIRSLNNEISSLTLIAPFAGHLIQGNNVKVGDYLSPGTAIGRLVDDSVMKLALYFTYGYLNEIQTGMSATISVPATMTNISGKVTSVERIRKVNSDGTVCFRVNFEMNNPGTLTEGLEATAYLFSNSGEKLLPYDIGILKFRQETTLTALSSGECTQANIVEFSDYKNGDVLLKLSNPSLHQTLDEEQKNLVSLQERIMEYSKQVKENVLTSPINGMITSMVIQPGNQLAGNGTPVVVIADLTQMIVATSIDEIDISKVSLGMPVSIMFDQIDGTIFMEGTITELSYEATSTGGKGSAAYFPATITISNPGNLKPGMGVSYTINAVTKEDVLMVPSSAIINTEFGPAVFVRSETSNLYPSVLEVPADSLPKGFIAVPVTIGLSDAMNTEIMEGLGENVEVYVQQSDMPGMPGGGVIVK